MSALVVISTQCFAAYESDRGTLMQGYAIWSLCRDCRPGALAVSDAQKENDDCVACPEGLNE